MTYLLMSTPLSILAVAFLLWLLSNVMSLRCRWLGTIALASLLILPSYVKITALAGRVYRDDFSRLLLLQAIVIGLALIARQFVFSEKLRAPFSKYASGRLIALAFV